MHRETELVALDLLSHKPNTNMVPLDVVDRLLANGLVERRVGELVVTSRGHALLLSRSKAKATS